MFDYARNLQLALTDRLRRAGLMAGAGAALLVAAGFLLAALWIWLARHLGWGPLGASLALGLGFLLAGLVLMLAGGRERHPLPTTDDLKAEVEQRLMVAADVAVEKITGAADEAMGRASQRAETLMDSAQQRVHCVVDDLSYKADRLAGRAEARAHGAARALGESAARRLGLPPDAVERAARGAGRSRAAPFMPLIGAFAVGLTLASRLRRRTDDDDRPG